MHYIFFWCSTCWQYTFKRKIGKMSVLLCRPFVNVQLQKMKTKCKILCHALSRWLWSNSSSLSGVPVLIVRQHQLKSHEQIQNSCTWSKVLKVKNCQSPNQDDVLKKSKLSVVRKLTHIPSPFIYPIYSQLLPTGPDIDQEQLKTFTILICWKRQTFFGEETNPPSLHISRSWYFDKGKPSVVRKQAKANKSKALLLIVPTILAVQQNFHFS